MKYYNYISGGMTLSHLLAALTFAFIGWSVYKILTGALRDRGSHRSPAKWSWKFWLTDNFNEAWQHALIMFCLIRFFSEIFARLVPNSAELLASDDPMWPYFLVGLAKAYIINALRKKKLAKK